MKEYVTDKLRNIALVGHQGSGKTSLAEAMLFDTGATTRLGSVQDGTTTSDYDEEEKSRGLSINTSVIPVEFQDHKINALDTPGYTDFAGEVIGAVRVSDAVLVLVDAVAGVEVGTELAWGYADEYNLPRFVVLTKMDRDNARFENALENLRAAFPDVKFVPFQLQIGSQQEFKGVVDLIAMKARLGRGDQMADIPPQLQEAADEARFQIMEIAAENDEELLEKYFNDEELTDEEIKRGLKAAVTGRAIVPVFLTASTADIGAIPLMEAILAFLPSPAEVTVTVEGPNGEETLQPSDDGPLAVYVFKTAADRYVGTLNFFRVFSGLLKADSRYYNANKEAEERVGALSIMRGKEQIHVQQLHTGDIGAVAKLAHTSTGDTLCDKNRPLRVPPPKYPSPLYSVAVYPKSQADSTKMGPVLTSLTDTDPTLRWHQDSVTNEAILEGMGDVHIDVAIKRAGKLGVNLEPRVPKVPYKETITKVNRAQYRHKKQTGGAGQFAEVHLRVEPLPRGAGFEYDSEVFGGAISQAFIPSIEKGIKAVMSQGVLAGYPVVDVKAVVYDGKEHPVDSKDIAFQIAGREAFKLAVSGANPVLLEPIMKLTVTVPENYMGDVLSDLNTRRARVQGMDTQGGKSVVTALVPLAEIQRYATDLRSITGGRGVYTVEFSHYEEVPQHVAQGVIEAAKREKENG